MPENRLFIDVDDTEECVRIWNGAVIVGELKTTQRGTLDDEEIVAARWTGWMSSLAVAELFGSYSAETRRLEAVDG